MRIYAERPGRVLLQVGADAFALAWAGFGISVALGARTAVLALQGPAQDLATAGEAIRGTFDGAARTAGQVPFVGEQLAGALGAGTGAGDGLAAAGRDQVAAIAAVADGTLGVLVGLTLLPLLLGWVPLRVRYALRAGAAVRARRTDPDLLALRALTSRPVHRLLRVTPAPTAAWRSGDPAALSALAAVELRALGLRSGAPARPVPGPRPSSP